MQLEHMKNVNVVTLDVKKLIDFEVALAKHVKVMLDENQGDKPKENLSTNSTL